jgi:tRNA-(ms[2]io[6]A)-hydroxylase
MVETLTPIVAEEWGHFQRVLKELKKRNIPLGRQRKTSMWAAHAACEK